MLLRGNDSGMDDGVQLVDALALKCKFRKASPIKPAIGLNDFRAERRDDFRVDGLAGFHEHATERVGFDDVSAQPAQIAGDGALAAAKTASQSNTQHGLCAPLRQAASHPGGAHGVGHEHRDGERPTPPGTGV